MTDRSTHPRLADEFTPAVAAFYAVAVAVALLAEALAELKP